MSSDDSNVLHVIGSDTPSARLEVLKVLRAQPGLGRQRVVQLGGGSVECTGLGAVERVPAPLGVGWLARRSLQDAVSPAGLTVVHIWSAKALEWVMPAAKRDQRLEPTERAPDYRLLMDVEFPVDFDRLASAFSWLWSEGRMGFVAPTVAVRKNLASVGVSPDDCVLIRDSVDFAAINAVSRSDVRSHLGLSAEDTAVLVLPPVLRETGASVAAWAALLLVQVRPNVRLVVPGVGREVDRVVRLIESCRHEWMLRTAGRSLASGELVAAADLVVYLPPGDAPASGLSWALAAGTPIVAAAVPATTELLTHGHNAWLCRADDPKAAARRMLQALEDRQQSENQGRLARSEVFGLFSRRRMIEQYRRTYETLLADRRVAGGVAESALTR